jgi:hypothetical protein
MRTCLINDCTGFVDVAPCCLDCGNRDTCPDRCPKTETTFCVGVLNDDSKGISAAIQISSEGD